MKKLTLTLLAVLAVLGLSAPAQARGFVGIGIGCCAYRGYYAPYYDYPGYPYPGYYGYPTYYAPPPTVVYEQPAPSVTYVSPPAPAPQAQAAPAATYTDGKGRTCRAIQSNIDGSQVNGTACLQPDGTWRTVGE